MKVTILSLLTTFLSILTYAQTHTDAVVEIHDSLLASEEFIAFHRSFEATETHDSLHYLDSLVKSMSFETLQKEKDSVEEVVETVLNVEHFESKLKRRKIVLKSQNRGLRLPAFSPRMYRAEVYDIPKGNIDKLPSDNKDYGLNLGELSEMYLNRIIDLIENESRLEGKVTVAYYLKYEKTYVPDSSDVMRVLKCRKHFYNELIRFRDRV